MFASRSRLNSKLICIGLIALALSGCRAFNRPLMNANAGFAEIPNPVPVPMMDRWTVMDQVSDEIDNYFRIYREERIRIVDNVMSEGWIETHPKIGATILEPWHPDSTDGFERMHATLQTVRRFAKVRVIPDGNGYQLDVKVYKELEDLPEPQHSTVTGRTLWHDSALDTDYPDDILTAVDPKNKGWIPMGRDFSLEQQILRNIQSRLVDVNQVGHSQIAN